MSNNHSASSIDSNTAITQEITKFLEGYHPKEYSVSDVKLVSAGFASRIYSATISPNISPSNSKEDALCALGSPKKVLFRFPISSSPEEMEQHIAVLSLLQNLNLYFKTPRILEYDLRVGEENGLQHPYLVMDYIPGVSLDKIYKTLSFEQKLQVVKELVSLLVAMESIHFPRAGPICPKDPLPPYFLFNSDVAVGEATTKGFANDLEAPEDLQKLLSVQLDHWTELNNKQEEPAFMGEKWDTLAIISSKMKSMGYFEGASCETAALHHWDLFPRNIIVRLVTSQGHETSDINSLSDLNTRIEIAAVIDWDEPRAVHKVLARQPQTWLWGVHPTHKVFSQYYDCEITCTVQNDVDLISPEKYATDCNTPFTLESKAIKSFFDYHIEKSLPGYYDDAYGKGRWIRRLCRFLIDEFHDHDAFSRYDTFVEEWEEEFGEIEGFDTNGAEEDMIDEVVDSRPITGIQAEAEHQPTEDMAENTETKASNDEEDITMGSTTKPSRRPRRLRKTRKFRLLKQKPEKVSQWSWRRFIGKTPHSS